MQFPGASGIPVGSSNRMIMTGEERWCHGNKVDFLMEETLWKIRDWDMKLTI
jgi:hypothetical protein